MAGVGAGGAMSAQVHKYRLKSAYFQQPKISKPKKNAKSSQFCVFAFSFVRLVWQILTRSLELDNAIL